MNFQGKLDDNKAQFIEWLNNTITETYEIAVSRASMKSSSLMSTG